MVQETHFPEEDNEDAMASEPGNTPAPLASTPRRGPMPFTEAPPGSVSPGVPLGRGWQETVLKRPCPPAPGLARSHFVAREEGVEVASRGSPLAPADNDRCWWKSCNPWTQAGEQPQ